MRLNFEVSEETRNNLESLKIRTEASSLSEVFRKALALYDLAQTETDNGNKLILETPTGRETIILL